MSQSEKTLKCLNLTEYLLSRPAKALMSSWRGSIEMLKSAVENTTSSDEFWKEMLCCGNITNLYNDRKPNRKNEQQKKQRQEEGNPQTQQVGGHSPFIEVKNNQVAHIPMTIMFQSWPQMG